MWVQYNGIDLEAERVVQWSDRNIYSEDNTERYLRHVAFAVQCVIHPNATFLADLAQFSAAGVVAELKRRLLVPRGYLRVKVGDQEVLSSPQVQRKAGTPATNYPDGSRRHYCDARGGPNPLYVDVTSIHGAKTMLATFAVETWLADNRVGNDLNPNEQSALIAHRWEQRNDLDEHYYSTRTTSGRAVFRADWLYTFDETSGYLRQEDLKPQDYLAYLNHPLPLNYRRDHVSTRVSSDGLTLDYTITDVEQQSTIEAAKPVSRVEGTWSASVDHGSLLECPGHVIGINVQCWGRRGATRNQLIEAAVRAASTYDDGVGADRKLMHHNVVSVNMSKLHVSFNSTYRVQGLLGWLAAAIWAGRPGVELAQKGIPDVLQGGLGWPSQFAALGQQPMYGMVGGLDNDPPGGGQQRLNTQQVGDQFVPAQPPFSTRASLNQTTEVDVAARARSTDQRRTE